MRSQRFSLGVAGVLAACLFSLSAQANSGGIFGRSGKQGSAMTCMAAGCHALNPSTKPAPTVTLTGPSSLAAGATGNYTLTIEGGEAVKAGVNVAVSSGALNVAGGDLKKEPGSGGELTHTAPKAFTANQAQFAFSLVAPASAGTVTIFASGNSTNGNANNDGDRSASTTLEVQITGGTQNPDPEPEPKPDDGGCSAAGGAPLGVLLALIAAAGLRRRSA